MRTVQEITGARKAVGDLGIEIETEAVDPYVVPPIPGWKAITDGSLRDFGMEYVSKGPIAYADLKPALKNWKDALGGVHRKLRTDSISTSVHVHVNMQDQTPVGALNFYLCSILFENVLSQFAGPDRIGNLFCLRTVDAEDQFNSIKRNVQRATNDAQFLNGFNPNNYKYSNVNTVPLLGFGSVEHRVMRGTTDIDEILVWSQTLHNIREFAKSFDTPVDIVRGMKNLGVEGLLDKGLGEHKDQFKYNDWELDLLRNFIYVADMATCRTDWNLKAPESKVSKNIEYNFNQLRAPQPAANPAQAVVWDEDFEEEDM